MKISTSQQNSLPLFFLIYGLFASIYIYFRVFEPWLGGIFIKVIPLLMLIAWAGKTFKDKTRTIILFALFWSMMGDIFMSLEGMFLFGLSFFLIAQISYCVLFVKQGRWQLARLPWLVLVVLYIALIANWILPQTGEFKWAVLSYMCAISLMAITAGFRNTESWLWTAVGALVFMLSDTLIAINKFAFEIPYSGIYIMATYYMAQALIVFGLIKNYQDDKRAH